MRDDEKTAYLTMGLLLVATAVAVFMVHMLATLPGIP